MDFDLPKDLGKKDRASAAVFSSSIPAPGETQREKEVIKAYLNALIRDHKDLDPRGIKQTKVQLVLPLEEIYVSLQAEQDRPDVDRRVLQEELADIRLLLEQVEDPREREKQYQIWATQARILRASPGLTGQRQTLHDIARATRQSVILGDPGSGKTTLLRYLALKMAKEIMSDIDRFLAPRELGKDNGDWAIPGLGAVRLPIYMRIAKYADARGPKQGGNPNTPLLDFLPVYYEGLQVPDAAGLGPIFRKYLEQGRCLVLLDGLDEIVEPTERRNIASAIDRFTGTFRDTVPGGSDPFNENVPTPPKTPHNQKLLEVQEPFLEKVPGRRRHFRELDSREGNRFVVTSRIAGYHFAPLAGEFAVFTIRPMEIEDIQLFLEKWCPAVERRMTDEPDPVKVQETAQREISGILEAVRNTPGVRRMASNPLLLRILALVHRGEAHLPQRRVELYETAATTLLRDWNLQRELKVSIDEKEALSLLGMVALWTHEHRATGLITRGEVEEILGVILAFRQGIINQEEREQRLSALATGVHAQKITPIPPGIERAVTDFLISVREHSGLYVERGEGLYGFMHLTFQEYFAARQLVSNSTKARDEILLRLHRPRWREPILLAVGVISHQFYESTDILIQAIIDSGKQDPYEPTLHRGLLFAAACVGDSVNIYPRRRREIARQLMELYLDRAGRGRYKTLQKQIKIALLGLCNEQGDEAVEQALAEIMNTCPDPLRLTYTLEVVDFLKARSHEVLEALENCFQRYTLPGLHNTLYAMKQRIADAEEKAKPPVPTGWQAYLNPETARFMCVLWYYRWEEYLTFSLELKENTVQQINEILQPVNNIRAVTMCRKLLIFFGKPSNQRDSEYWDDIYYKIWDIVSLPRLDRELKIAVFQLTKRFEKYTEDKSGLIWTPQDIYRYLSDLELTAEETREIANNIDEAISEFQEFLEIYEKKWENYNPVPDFEAAGMKILAGAKGSQTLATYFAEAAKKFIPLTPFPRDENLTSTLYETITGIGNHLMEILEHTGDFQFYREIALFLIFRQNSTFANIYGIEEEFAIKITSYLVSELGHTQENRRRWSLQLLAEPAFKKYIKLPDIQRDILLKMLDGPVDRGLCALPILDLTPVFLSWCWETLRCAVHPLVAPVREKLERLESIPGNTAVLDFLAQGMRDPALQTVALEMLQKINWEGIPTFATVLGWLTDPNKELRQIGALLLSQQWDIFKDVKELIKEMPLEQFKTLSFEELSQVLIYQNYSHPLIIWLEEQLAIQGLSLKTLTDTENIRKLAGLLLKNDGNIRAAAALGVISLDLYRLILKPLAEGALSENDWIRNSPFNKLSDYCAKLPTDGSSLAVNELLKLRYTTRNDAKGYTTVTYYSSLTRVQHTHLHILKGWLETLANPDAGSEYKEIAELGFNEMGKLPEPALQFLLEQAGNTQLPANIPELIFSALWQNQRDPDQRYNEPWLNQGLCRLLPNSGPALRPIIARLLQWCEGSSSAEVAQVLLDMAGNETDQRTRLVCIRSTGRVLHAARLFHKSVDTGENAHQRGDSLETLSHLKGALSEIESYLGNPNKEIRQAAACALACVYLDDAGRISILEDKLPDAETIMWSFIESISDDASYWQEEDYHEKNLKQLAGWLLEQPETTRSTLVNALLKEAEKLLSKAQETFKKYGTITTPFSNEEYLKRDYNVVIGVLSELSEQITSRGFTGSMAFDEVLNIFITAACNPNSWITRRGGIKALGNFQHFNKEVAQVFFEACQDIDEVNVEARGAVGKFKRFDDESLAILTGAIGHSSASVSYHAALLLGELGVSRSEELGAEGRRQVAEALRHLLETTEAERTVYDFTKRSKGQRIGPLYDVLYDSLVRVIAGPDARAMIKGDESD